MFLEVPDEPAAHARSLRLWPHAECSEEEDLPPIVRLPVSRGEGHDPPIERNQPREPRHPHRPGQLSPRRVESPFVVPRLGVERGHGKAGALVEKVNPKFFGTLAHPSRLLPRSIILRL